MKKLSAVFLVSILAFQLYAQAQSSGKIEFSSMPSEILGVDREFAVYLPKSYRNNPDKKYPVLYLLHGGGDTHTAWPVKGGLEAAANQIIDSKESAEIIIVCPEAGKIHMNYFNDSEWRYEDYFFEELIPYIESNYRAIPDKDHRAVAGLSMGGGGTLVYAQHHPEMFAAAFAMSSYLYRMNLSFLDPNDPETEKRQQIVERNNAVKLLLGASEEKVKQLKTVDWFIDCGDDDFTFTPNMEFVVALKEQGIPYQLRVRDGGHTWEYWHSSLYIALPHISDVFRELTQK